MDFTPWKVESLLSESGSTLNEVITYNDYPRVDFYMYILLKMQGKERKVI